MRLELKMLQKKLDKKKELTKYAEIYDEFEKKYIYF